MQCRSSARPDSSQASRYLPAQPLGALKGMAGLREAAAAKLEDQLQNSLTELAEASGRLLHIADVMRLALKSTLSSPKVKMFCNKTARS